MNDECRAYFYNPMLGKWYAGAILDNAQECADYIRQQMKATRYTEGKVIRVRDFETLEAIKRSEVISC